MLHLDLIPRNRLQNIPPDLRVKHEYCFFLHDQCVQILKEYEEAKANHVTVNFESDREIDFATIEYDPKIETVESLASVVTNIADGKLYGVTSALVTNYAPSTSN